MSYPVLGYWGARERRICVRALDGHGGFVEGDVREVPVPTGDEEWAGLHLFRATGEGATPEVEVRVFLHDGSLRATRFRLGIAEPQPIRELDDAPRGMAIWGGGSGGSDDAYRWATADGLYDLHAWDGTPSTAIPGLLRWVPGVWTTTDTLWAGEAEHTVPGIDGSSRVLAIRGVEASGGAVVVDGELLPRRRHRPSLDAPASPRHRLAEPRERVGGATGLSEEWRYRTCPAERSEGARGTVRP